MKSILARIGTSMPRMPFWPSARSLGLCYSGRRAGAELNHRQPCRVAGMRQLMLGLAALAGRARAPPPGSLGDLGSRVDNSWLAQLSADPDTANHAPNKRQRMVNSGHYVLVKPTPLPSPYMVAHSREVADVLELHESELSDRRALGLLSGRSNDVPGFDDSWATPYALSIYGQVFVPNNSGESGNGYGDGRAISIGEVVGANGSRWELQLKGAGTTPFCRGSDGRAVLRSSVREFLASETMHHLGVSTTRALSLVASKHEHARRPWYSNKTKEFQERRNDWAAVPPPRPSRPPPSPPDIVQTEPVAITCRVSRSFIRVGHFELYARRAEAGDTTALAELELLARHAIFRDFPEQVRRVPVSVLLFYSTRFIDQQAHCPRLIHVGPWLTGAGGGDGSDCSAGPHGAGNGSRLSAAFRGAGR